MSHVTFRSICSQALLEKSVVARSLTWPRSPSLDRVRTPAPGMSVASTVTLSPPSGMPPPPLHRKGTTMSIRTRARKRWRRKWTSRPTHRGPHGRGYGGSGQHGHQTMSYRPTRLHRGNQVTWPTSRQHGKLESQADALPEVRGFA